jgi:hypothetical protein
VFQNVWSAKLPWVEFVVDKQGKVNLVRCKVFSKINGKAKMFAPKIESLHKHVGKKKALMVVLGVCGAREYYMSKDSVHAKNETWLYAIARKDSTFKQAYHAVVGKKKKKLMQFSTCFHMLVEGRPMTNFESMNKLLHFLDGPRTFQKPIGQIKMVGKWHLACKT